MNILTCPVPTFQRLLRALTENRGRVAFVRVGAHAAPPDREWLVHDLLFVPADYPAPPDGPFFRVALTSHPLSLSLVQRYLDLSSPAVVGLLSLGDGPLRARLWGAVRTADAIEPLHSLFLTGAGMQAIPLVDQPSHEPTLPHRHRVAAQNRWSRTIGALGGEDIWQRLVRLHVALIGCGRSGSLVAATLVRLGIRALTLIDPDLVEEHNLGEMDLVTQADVGRPKAQVLAERLKEAYEHSENEAHLTDAPSIQPILSSVTAESALAACKDAHVLFSCVDNDAARLAVALIATLYHKVLIDIGTGVHFTQMSNPARDQDSVPRPRIMGADVRMILPASGCLLCVGNLTRYQQAIEDLCHGRPLPLSQEDWRQQRAGSLRTLNQLAVNLGVQMLQDLVTERIQESQWAQLAFDDAGRMTVEYPQVRPATSCLLCAKAGLGDEAMHYP